MMHLKSIPSEVRESLKSSSQLVKISLFELQTFKFTQMHFPISMHAKFVGNQQEIEF
jgi:hypothetical protein